MNENRSTYKAAVRKKYGGPKRITISEVTLPKPNAKEILVQVKATTVNRTDCANLRAKPFIMRFVLGFFRPKRKILGTDFAGVVTQVGEGVDQFQTGDRVFAFGDVGLETQAEYSLVPSDKVYQIPTRLDFRKAAASLEGAHYAYSFIHKTEIQKGDRILVNGVTGAIGSALIQMLKQFDVHIAATCDTPHISLVTSLGADKVYDYTKEDFTESVDRYDFVFDTVGKSTVGKCKKILEKDGVYISSELGPFSQNLFYSLMPFLSPRKVIFPVPYKTEETIPYIMDLLEREIFTPVIHRSYSLEHVSEAYEFVLKGQKIGNVVLNI